MSASRILSLILLLLWALGAYPQALPPIAKNPKTAGITRPTDSPIPFPAANESWVRARSKHFVFISSADENRTRAIAAEFETLAAALTKMDATFSTSSGPPARVIVFANPRESRPYFDMLRDRPNSDVSGVFVSQREGGTMLINDRSTWRGGDRPSLHELVHDLLESGGAPIPLWLDEGLAEYFSNATIRRGSVSAGEPMRNHIATLRQRPRIPPAELFVVTRQSDTYNLPSGQDVFYAESWAIVDWLVRTASRSGAEFYAFVHDVANGVPVATALQTHYRRSLRDIDRALTRYMNAPRAEWTITIPVPQTDTSATLRPIDRATVLYELGHFIAGTEDRPGEAGRHYRAALDVNPKHAPSLAGLASLRVAGEKFAEAMPLFERAVAEDPNDLEIALAYAEALMQDQAGPAAQTEASATGDTRRFRKARALIQPFLNRREEPDFPTGRVMAALGISYSVEDDVTPGIAALEQARALLPNRIDLSIHLLGMYRRSGNREKAGQILAQLEAMTNPQIAAAARAVVARADVLRANALSRENHLDEAASVVRELAAGAGDEDARRDFEKQAAGLTHAATRNRQIEAYERIVAQVNSGLFREAIKALNTFLPTATEPDIVHDAKELQKQLAEWKP
jgi:tetratricopeptide (TPR) repeat protein